MSYWELRRDMLLEAWTWYRLMTIMFGAGLLFVLMAIGIVIIMVTAKGFSNLAEIYNTGFFWTMFGLGIIGVALMLVVIAMKVYRIQWAYRAPPREVSLLLGKYMASYLTLTISGLERFLDETARRFPAEVSRVDRLRSRLSGFSRRLLQTIYILTAESKLYDYEQALRNRDEDARASRGAAIMCLRQFEQDWDLCQILGVAYEEAVTKNKALSDICTDISEILGPHPAQ